MKNSKKETLFVWFFIALIFINAVILLNQMSITKILKENKQKTKVILKKDRLTFKQQLKNPFLIRYLSAETNQDIALIEVVLNRLSEVLLQEKLERYKWLFIAIILKESNFNPSARSKVAYGVMQIHFDANKKFLNKIGILTPVELYNIKTNIKAGVLLFKHHIKLTQENKNKVNLTKVLNLYSGDKTGNYAISVLSKAKKLKYIFENNKKG